jgi:hypothetical protein
LPFANVLIKGSNENTTTDIDGKYTISTAGVHIIQFSFIGYQSVEIPVTVKENGVVTVNIGLCHQVTNLMMLYNYRTNKKKQRYY